MKLPYLLVLSIVLNLACNTGTNYTVQVPDDVIQKTNLLSDSVIAYFSTKNDTMGLNAARFIMERIKYNYYYYGERQKTYIREINRNYRNKVTLKAALDSLKKLSLSNGEPIFDVSVITAKFLIKDIELAVKTYRQSNWKKDISFQVFCNYILPYRIKHEPIESWREMLQDSFFTCYSGSFFEQESDSAIRVAYLWLHGLKRGFEAVWGKNSLNIPDLQVSDALKLSIGSCSDLTNVSLGGMRALGIPASDDFTPQYLNMNIGHSWNVIVLDSVHIIPFDITERNAKLGNFKWDDFIISKAYRKSFEPVKGNHFSERGYCSFLPSFFNDPFILDVTPAYNKTSNIEINLFNNIANKTEFGYLCNFKHPEWNPVDFGKVKGSKLYCKNLTRNGVYLPISIEETGKKVIGDAFILKSDGQVQYLNPDKTNLQEVKLSRKYPFLQEFLGWAEKMTGGKFQGANKKDFSDAVDLHVVIKSPGLLFNTISLENIRKFRYVRYLSPKGSSGNIAEAQFFANYEDTVPLKGTIMGTKGSWGGNAAKTREAVFDGNDLTFFDSKEPDNSWAGLDLGRSVQIKKIRFIARNDKNYIYPGDKYELFYWDNEWKSLGSQIGDQKQYLVYKNVPSNALLWLRNLTAGKDERVFTWKNGKQVWW